MKRTKGLSIVFAVLIAMFFSACMTQSDVDQVQDSALKEELSASEQQNLETFDDLDFNVFTNQKWNELGHSHAKDVIVHWPDGHVTKGIDVHIEDLKTLFVFAPDTRILQHPIRIAMGEWTAVMGVMEGTFTKPMPLPDGTFIEPTGKSFILPMATLAHWKGETMDEEWLFWDNQSYFSQLGL